MPQGLKAAKDVYNKKNSTTVGGGKGAYHGSAKHNSVIHAERCETPSRGQKNKHYVMGNQNNGGSWLSRRSEASLWLQLINKLSKKSLLPVYGI